MKEYEKEIISAIKSLVINGVKNLDGYNNPFKNIANALIMEHEKEIKEIMNDCLENILTDGEFKAEIRQAIGQKVVREFASQSEYCKAEFVKVKKQLEIAIKALEIYADKTNWDNHFTIEINNCEIEVITFIEGTDKDGEFYAEKALQKIMELNK